MKKKRLVIFLASLSILMCGSGTILAMTETSVTNTLSTGIVDIELEEYRIQDGEEERYEDVKDILPGQVISKIPRIRNAGNDCYIRVKLELTGTEESIEIREIGENWVQGKDGYLYYTEVLKTGEETDLFQSIRIPEDFAQEENSTFQLKIDAEGIQSKNFTPDFEADAPWGAVEIQQCKKEGQYDISSFKQASDQSLRVVYEGDSQKLFSEPEDFFTNFPVMLPGDAYEETAVLQNTADKPVKLYFRGASEETADNDLLEQIGLTITTEIAGKTETVYEGALKGAGLEENRLLGEIPAQSTGNFHFALEVPEELDNQYTVLTNQVVWAFSTEPLEPLTPVQTGDLRKTGICLVVGGVLLGTGTLILRKRRTKDEESVADPL